MEHNLFLQISALLAITVSLAFIVRFLKQPLLAAYMLAGIVCGPFLFNLLQGQQDLYQAFSNFGVVLLLFIVGLELNFSYLKKIGSISTSIGLLQFLFNFAVILLIVNFFDISLISKIFLALVSCFSSTIVVLKILSDKQDEESVYGRYTVGLLLVQDIISIGILILLSFSANSGESFSMWSLAKVIGSFLLIFLFAKYLLSRIINHIAASGEFLFLFTVAWCFSVASLMVWSGFSLEIGAVIAGLSLSSSKYQPEIASRVKPLRDFFIVLFFVILGSSADFSNVSGVIIPAIILALAVVILKPIILFLIFRLFKFTRRNSFLSALTAAPLSEFGFIILFVVISAGYLSGPELSIFTIAAILTIFISSYLMTYSYQLYSWLLPFFKLFGLDKYVQQEDSKEKFDAVVFGYHRTGWKIGHALKKVGLKFAAVDFNPGNVHRLTHQDIKVFFGDASDVEFLRELPLEKTKIIISTIPSPEDQLVLLDFLKSKRSKPIVICTLYNKRYLDKLYEAGADYVILPHLLGGMWMSELIMGGMLKRKRSWGALRKLQAQDLEGSIESGLNSHLPS
jgi:Kef-type K+ transport system membrane component KefB